MSFKREVLEDGSVRLTSERCSFIYLRPRPGVVFLRIIGQDEGEFGTTPMDELRAWTEWFSGHRSELESVSILTRSKFMHFTAEVVKLFSRTGELIRVYLDPEAFDEALQRAAPGARRMREPK